MSARVVASGVGVGAGGIVSKATGAGVGFVMQGILSKEAEGGAGTDGGLG